MKGLKTDEWEQMNSLLRKLGFQGFVDIRNQIQKATFELLDITRYGRDSVSSARQITNELDLDVIVETLNYLANQLHKQYVQKIKQE